jgi:hypothetical protein
MEIKSELVEIPNNGNPSIEYFETELTKRNIKPLRWAVVHVSDKMYTVSVANLKE